jgi:hypothetical protein
VTAHARHTQVDTAADDLRDMIRDLTRTTTHHERYSIKRGTTTWRRDHITTVPPLLWQLEHATCRTSRRCAWSAERPGEAPTLGSSPNISAPRIESR